MEITQQIGPDGLPSVTVSWNANPESNIIGYTVYWGTNPTNMVNKVNVTSPATSAVVGGLSYDTTYYFNVTATAQWVDSQGTATPVESNPSTTVTFTTSPAPALVMNAYYLNSNRNDAYTSGVVYANDVAQARNTHPAPGNTIKWSGTAWVYVSNNQPVSAGDAWANPPDVIVTDLGPAPANATNTALASHNTPIYVVEVMKYYYLNAKNRYEGFVDAVVAAKNDSDARKTHPKTDGSITWDTVDSRWEYKSNGQVVSAADAWPAPTDTVNLVSTFINNAPSSVTAGAKQNHFTPLGVVTPPPATQSAPPQDTGGLLT